jgi:sugar phosphate isomerase/epimerase
MRVGVVTRGETGEIARIADLGFRSIEWMRFAVSPCAPENTDWKPYAEEIAAFAREKDVRISAIGAFYANPLDPPQTAKARAVIERAIEVAAHIGVKTVSGFAGAVIETRLNERGGNPVYEPFEKCIPQALQFWEPLARLAAERGVRIAFENCPQAPSRLPIMGYNMMALPAIWERVFDATSCENLGLEWDPSHLVCQLIDPVQNIRRFGSRIFHVHAKDAWVDRPRLEVYGICHPGAVEHRMPGLGQCHWPEIVRALLQAGYDSDLNIEGWHDPVYRDHPVSSDGKPPLLSGRKLEDSGLLIAQRTLENLVRGTE